MPETKRLLQGSAAGRAVGGGGGAKAETENIRRNPTRAAPARAAATAAMYDVSMSRWQKRRYQGANGATEGFPLVPIAEERKANLGGPNWASWPSKAMFLPRLQPLGRGAAR